MHKLWIIYHASVWLFPDRNHQPTISAGPTRRFCVLDSVTVNREHRLRANRFLSIWVTWEIGDSERSENFVFQLQFRTLNRRGIRYLSWSFFFFCIKKLYFRYVYFRWTRWHCGNRTNGNTVKISPNPRFFKHHRTFLGPDYNKQIPGAPHLVKSYLTPCKLG